MSLKITGAGPLVTVQDLGRFGFQRFGVPTSGAMDGLAIRAANELVCNPWNAACLEIGLGGVSAISDEPCVVALTGRGVSLVVDDHPLPGWSAVYLRPGWQIEVKRLDWGWAYLAIAGGIDVPLVLESRSTYLRGRLGGLEGRSLLSGDILNVIPSELGADIAGRDMSPPEYTDEVMAEVIPGPQLDRFTEAGVQAFLSAEYTVGLESDRMGYRLAGDRIAHTRGADLVSDGIVLGTVQVPQSGQPILMMSDHATTGGYTKLATMTTLDTWRVAQCMPGKGKVRFKTVGVEVAQSQYRQTLGRLAAQVNDLRDEGWRTW